MGLHLNKYALAVLPAAALDRLGLIAWPRVPLAYVAERANWSTKWDGTYICREVERIAPGSIWSSSHSISRAVSCILAPSFNGTPGLMPLPNRTAARSPIHGKPEDDDEMARHVDAFLALVPRAEPIVTAASFVEDRLLAWGVPREKLFRNPIGVDLDLSRPVTPDQNGAVRDRYGIDNDCLVIGCFQKDGVG